VLVVDDDPWSQQVISSQLAQAGLRVDSAGDGWEALILAGHGRPDLVIAELHLPTTTAWSMAETMRTQWNMKKIPFIFMADRTAGGKPGKTFRKGLDLMLNKPFTIQELRDVVEQALGSWAGDAPSNGAPKIAGEAPAGERRGDPFAEKPGPKPSQSWILPGLEPALRGSLASFGLSSLLMVIELERMSGVLMLKSPRGTGRMAIRQGRVIRAQVDGQTRPQGPLAIYDQLQWNQGSFQFDAGEVQGEDQIEMSTSFLLMEGARLLDERNHDEKKS
jgi:CheY-like chemotaxis protein